MIEQWAVERTADKVDSLRPFGRILPLHLEEYQLALWAKFGGAEVEPLLASGAVAMLDAHWLVAFYEHGGRRLARRRRILCATQRLKPAVAEGAQRLRLGDRTSRRGEPMRDE